MEYKRPERWFQLSGGGWILRKKSVRNMEGARVKIFYCSDSKAQLLWILFHITISFEEIVFCGDVLLSSRFPNQLRLSLKNCREESTQATLIWKKELCKSGVIFMRTVHLVQSASITFVTLIISTEVITFPEFHYH